MIQIRRMNCVALKVADIQRSMDWYREHFGFEYSHDAEGCVVVRTGNTELVLSPHDRPDAPLADPRKVRCIHTLGFEIPESEFGKLKDEFSEDDGLVEIDQDEFQSVITCDPDGYCVEVYYNKGSVGIRES